MSETIKAILWYLGDNATVQEAENFINTTDTEFIQSIVYEYYRIGKQTMWMYV